MFYNRAIFPVTELERVYKSSSDFDDQLLGAIGTEYKTDVGWVVKNLWEELTARSPHFLGGSGGGDTASGLSLTPL